MKITYIKIRYILVQKLYSRQRVTNFLYFYIYVILIFKTLSVEQGLYGVNIYNIAKNHVYKLCSIYKKFNENIRFR